LQPKYRAPLKTLGTHNGLCKRKILQEICESLALAKVSKYCPILKKGLVMNKLFISSVVVALMFIGCASDSASSAPKKVSKSNKKMMMFQSVPMDKATILQSGKDKMHCVKCGMKLPMFYKTNHAAKVDGVQK
jgi:hypothetical protein